MRLHRLVWIGFGAMSAIGSPLAQQNVRSGVNDNEQSNTPSNNEGSGNLVNWGLGLTALGATGVGGYLAGHKSMKPQIEQLKAGHTATLAEMRASLDKADEALKSSGQQNSQLQQQIRALNQELIAMQEGKANVSPTQAFITVHGKRMNMVEYEAYLVDSALCSGYRRRLVKSLPAEEWRSMLEYLDQRWPEKPSTFDDQRSLNRKIDNECQAEHINWIHNGRPGAGKTVSAVWPKADEIVDAQWKRGNAPMRVRIELVEDSEKEIRQKGSEDKGNDNPTTDRPMAFDLGGAKKLVANAPQVMKQWGSEMQKQTPGIARAAGSNMAMTGRMAMQNIQRPKLAMAP